MELSTLLIMSQLDSDKNLLLLNRKPSCIGPFGESRVAPRLSHMASGSSERQGPSSAEHEGRDCQLMYWSYRALRECHAGMHAVLLTCCHRANRGIGVSGVGK